MVFLQLFEAAVVNLLVCPDKLNFKNPDRAVHYLPDYNIGGMPPAEMAMIMPGLAPDCLYPAEGISGKPC